MNNYNNKKSMSFKKITFYVFIILIATSFVVYSIFLGLPIKQEIHSNISSGNVNKVAGDGSFISKWDTTKTSSGSSASNQIKLPLVSTGTYNFQINWGDGQNSTITSWNQVEVIHTYGSSGVYTITISGTIKGWTFNNNGDRLNIIEISQWGTLNLGNSGLYFSSSSNLHLIANDTPDLSGTTTLYAIFSSCSNLGSVGSMNSWDVSKIVNMSGMFAAASTFNQPIGSWNVSSVKDMKNMFLNTLAFNQPIGSWNVSGVTNMASMFAGSRVFNQNISLWDVSSVTNMNSMFSSSGAFNQNISLWNVSAVTNMKSIFMGDSVFNQNIGFWKVSKVTDMSSMFYSDNAFNQPIGQWDVSKVTDMSYMFCNSLFNQSLASWNVSSVNDMSYMFSSASVFNQNISSWNVSTVTNMAFMFAGASVFNQNISLWNVSKVKDMNSMFEGAYKFNQDISLWNVSKVTDMSYMFYSATTFDQAIGLWNVLSVTNLAYMFTSATKFNQPLGTWNISAVTDVSHMFSFDTLSGSNYDNILIGWSTLPLHSNLNLDAGNSKYTTNAKTARQYIITHFNWIISDAGEIIVPNAPQNLIASSGNSFVILHWNYPLSDGGSPIIKYNIYRSSTASLGYVFLTSVSVVFYNDTFVSNSITYYYIIKAVNVAGEGAESNNASAMPSLLVPSAPFLYITSHNSYIYLNWTNFSFDGGSPILKYQVYRGTSSRVYSFIGVTTNSFYNDTNIEVSTMYYYSVSAINAQGESQFSNEVSATDLGIPQIPPTIPKAPIFSATAGNQSVYLTWTAPADGGSSIIKYLVYRGEFSYQYSFVGVTTHLFFNDTNLSGGTKYFYVVSAVNAIGESNFSTEMSVTPFGPTSMVKIITQIQTTTLISTTTVIGTQPGSTITNNNTNVSSTSSSSSSKASPGFEFLPFLLAFSLISISFLIRRHRN